MQAFQNELNVVLRRQEWLIAVLESNEEKLQELLQGDNANDGASTGDSRDLSAAARAGPCAGYTGLKPLQVLCDHGQKYRSCQCPSDLKTVTEEIAPLKKLLAVLIGSCKTAVTELRGAKQRAINADEAAKKKREKEEETEQRKRAAGKKSGRPAAGPQPRAEHPVFRIEGRGQANFAVDHSATRWDDGWQMIDACILTGIETKSLCGDEDIGKKVEQSLVDFGKAFNESSLKAGSFAIFEHFCMQ